MRLLISGGTVFVSKYLTKYFIEKNHEVYVLNRGTRQQVPGANLIKADRHQLKNQLKNYHFDAVIDVCAYNQNDVRDLLKALNSFDNYLLISSSAVYPKTNPQPFSEEQDVGYNTIWQDYGINKIKAEQELLSQVLNAYIIRPAYIYGPMQNIYREPFVFECALKKRKFYIPNDGSMKLQFIHVDDIARMIEKIITSQPSNQVFNAGNRELVSIKEFVSLCYQIVNTPLEIINVYDDSIDQRQYFSFYNYQYCLDVTKQDQLIGETVSLKKGLEESFAYYLDHQDEVIKKNYLEFIDRNLQ
ncbi:NAD-dependent epimerase/dehydratase family protein [uncultured Thomasclavelia sp.]|uniref:NAD-dependent epimerase/dehydratase family protein n=1 Tax=uncultured Thomasclavelia sp. TaxID=3025759 RepID=UPI0025F90A53|nr:NAD-dependent epimerase/dehydratase family protein [uncultured Thomasclavelia sp.]